MATPKTPQPLTLTEALIPIVSLIILVGISFYLFGDEGALGPNQVALVVATMVAVFVAWRRGHTLDSLREAAVASVGSGLGAIFILLAGVADRHLGDERDARGDGLLRAATAKPELLLHDCMPDLRRDIGEHRQLLDVGGHHRHRAYGHRGEHGSQPGDRRRRGDFRRLCR